MAIVPSVPEGKYVDVGGGHRMHYHEAGSGPAVIFVHGSGPGASGWSNFKQNYEAIAAAGYRCLVPDLLGYGYSSMPAQAKFTWADVVDGLAGFAEAVNARDAAWVGNSMGGALCIQIALDRPELVSRLVLMAPGGLEERDVYMGMSGIRSMLKALTAPEGITRESMRRVFTKQLYDQSLITEAILDERHEIAVQQPRGMFEKLVVPNLADRLSQLTQPILGFWGTDDQFTPVSGALRLAQACKRTKMIVLSECGHWVMVEHAALFNDEVVRFLAGGAGV